MHVTACTSFSIATRVGMGNSGDETDFLVGHRLTPHFNAFNQDG